MQDYSNRQGQLRWKAVMWQGALVRKKTPSVLAVSPTPCALQLYRITLFTGSTGGAALGESDYMSLQNNHIKTRKSGNLTLGIMVGGGCLRPSLEVKIQQCRYIRVGIGKGGRENDVCIVQ